MKTNRRDLVLINEEIGSEKFEEIEEINVKNMQQIRNCQQI